MTTVLLVDDDKPVLRGMHRLLQNRGFDVVAFESPAKALAALPGLKLDIVVSDHHMPDMCGVDLLAEIGRRMPRAGRVLVTGHPDLSMLMGAINHGHVDQFLEKPIDSSVLVRTLTDVIRAARRRAPAAVPPAPRRVIVGDVDGDELLRACLEVGTSTLVPRRHEDVDELEAITVEIERFEV